VGDTMIRITRGIVLFGACAAVAACAKKNNAADSAAAADSASRAAAAAAPPPPPAAAPLNDANILALLDEINMADSANGNLAASKGTAADVKSYGRDMERDHHMLRKSGQDLAKKISVTPTPPANDTLPATAAKMHDNLTATPKGAAFDKAYIDGEVAIHQFALSSLQNFQTAASDTTLKATIGKVIPMIQQHLDKAQKAQTKLASAPAADSAKKK
jgi:putative membrane protein